MENRVAISPAVIALAGLPGAGKSTLARVLCERFALTLIDRDAIRDAMFPRCRYSEAEKQAAEQVVKDGVADACRQRRNALVDGMTFGRQSVRDEFAALAGASGARFFVLWLDCPAAVAGQRVASDLTHVAADRGPGLVDRVAAYFETPGPEAGRIDATLPAAEVVRQAREWLGEKWQLEEQQ